MTYIAANGGVRLHYEVHGRGSRDLLLLHGMGTSDTWRPLVPHLDLDSWRAQILGLSVRTIYKHVENIFRKLGVENRAGAMLRARQSE